MEEGKRGRGRPPGKVPKRKFNGTSFHLTRRIAKDLEEELAKLAKEEQYHTAFEKALNNANLSVLVFLCKQVEPREVFRDESVTELSQTQILSLIQQLAVHLDHDTETKVAYLHESIEMLDRDNQITREQMPVVLQFLSGELYQAIDNIQRTDPGDEQLKSMKALLRSSRTLLSRCKR